MPGSILTVDDSRSVRAALRDALEDLGLDVLEAEDGEAGLAMLTAYPVDVMITDLNMPRLDGIGLIRRVRADARFAGLPILMLTTESRPELMREGRAAGASGWIVKPFNDLQIERALRKFIALDAA